MLADDCMMAILVPECNGRSCCTCVRIGAQSCSLHGNWWACVHKRHWAEVLGTLQNNRLLSLVNHGSSSFGAASFLGLVSIPHRTAASTCPRDSLGCQVILQLSTLQARLNMLSLPLQDILDKVHLRNTNKRNFTILNSVSGVIKPGVFTLLLGPPGSGKTTLLTALAGKLQGVGGVKVRGADPPNYCCSLCNAGRAIATPYSLPALQGRRGLQSTPESPKAGTLHPWMLEPKSDASCQMPV